MDLRMTRVTFREFGCVQISESRQGSVVKFGQFHSQEPFPATHALRVASALGFPGVTWIAGTQGSACVSLWFIRALQFLQRLGLSASYPPLTYSGASR